MIQSIAPGRWPALGVSAFRAYWIGGLISDIGNWVQAATVPYVVLVQTHQVVWVGVATAVGQLAQAAMILPGGRLADRARRRRVLLFGNSAQLILAAILAVLYASGHLQAWEIIAVTGVMSLAFGLQHPSWQTLPPDLVTPALLPSASHLTVTKFQAARALGPLLAGLLLAGPGAAYAFWFNAASFIAALAALRWIPQGSSKRASHHLTREVQTSLPSTPFAVPGVLAGVLLTLAIAVLGLPIVQLATLLCADTYHAGADAYGALVSAFGWGSLVMAVTVSAFHGRGSRRRAAVGGLAVLSIAELTAATIAVYPAGVAAMAMAGMSFALMTTATHAAIQALSPQPLRGRAVAAYLFALRGGGGGGAMVLTWLASLSGVRTALALCGGVALVLVTCFAVRPRWVASLDAVPLD